MTNEVVHIRSNVPVVVHYERTDNPQVRRHIKRMAAIADATKEAANQMGYITVSSSEVAIDALSTIHRHVQDAQACGPFSDEDNQRLEKLKANMTDRIEQIADDAQNQLVSIIDTLPPNIGNTLLDDIAEALGL